MIRRAVLDPTGAYRFVLERRWNGISAVVWVMLNPSTADAEVDDPTIRKVCGFSRQWGYGTAVVVNLFALRSTDPKELKHHPDPVGPGNDEFIMSELRQAKAVVCAWGNHGVLHDRDEKVYRMIRETRIPLVLGLNQKDKKTGRIQPVHPLYQPYGTPTSLWIK